ncbi:integrating conjugative element protein [Pseudomonas sp. H11T01]|uniref:integrating conjugative element protein n=1 Tax=Pseudomonas sp. H11T01 TaxID=3402749 RepID=UPI003AC9B2FF
MKRIPLTCCCILLWTSFAQAELTVVGDSPDKVTLPYFHVTGAQMSDRALPDRAMHADLSTFTDEAWILPVRSSQLSPGPITPRTLNMPGLQPFFLVGGDPQSLTWLRQRSAGLRDIGAVGLAVEVADTQSLARIRAAAPGLTILPVNGNEIAVRLQIEHYPVLIRATALEQ